MYQLKVTLLETDAPIWRRLRIPADTTLRRLHQILQVTMGWTDSHLHMFTAGGVHYAKPDPEWEFEVRDEGRVRIEQVMREEGEAFIYEYDLGDSWSHQVALEGIWPHEALGQAVVCLGGERACPLEDSGSVQGYYEKLEILKDQTQDEYEDTKTWVESMAAMSGRAPFDPEAFNVAKVNAALRRLRV